MAKKTDTQTLKLIDEVKRRKAEIAQIERPNWITNCSYNDGSGPINLHVESSIAKLVSIAAKIFNDNCAYDEMAKQLDVNAPTFTYDGFSADDWIADIRTRIAKLEISTKKAALVKLEQRLERVISPELRTQMELEAIEAELGA